MDILALDGTEFNKGVIVNGLTSKLWVERYREPGEFTIKCPPTDLLRSLLNRGTIISHVDTLEVMMVEDHEIDETTGEDPVLVVTGRSVDAFLEHRAATNTSYGLTNYLTDVMSVYTLSDVNYFTQITHLLEDQLTTGILDPMDVIPNVGVLAEYGAVLPSDPSVIARASLDTALYSMLEVLDLGIKTQRPYAANTDLLFVVHEGSNKAGSIQFTWSNGDLATGRYLWSNRSYKNGAIAFNRYVAKVVRPGSGETGFNVRMMLVDATDFDVIPDGTPGTLAYIESVLEQRALEALASQKEDILLEATVTSDSTFKYRTDYNVGDLVYVNGNYGVSSTMRVIEHVESEDESGVSSYPTLAAANL